ncbi:hypothetical protein HPB51_015599 [Rhipicephalus microplus]|uniref:Uncharacterized protein n=1 Tax=Rhipicephalus microplus TaxID=6941 RepID=A0A9J6DHI4_RHIMP|nr:hypothetical protein HPB51_015599 [Rhipicephalus microplus]
MPKTLPSSRNTSPAPVDTPVHRESCRQRGLPPETPTTDAATMTSTQDPVQAPTLSTPIYCTVQNQLMPSPFHGEQHEDVDDWLKVQAGSRGVSLSHLSTESLQVNLPKVSVLLEADTVHTKVPTLFLQASLDADIHDWSSKMYLTADMKLEALYYSEERSTWEPLIEPVMECENSYRPWELVIKVFREQGYSIVSAQDSHSSKLLGGAKDGVSNLGSCGSASTSDDASETEMTVIRKQPFARPKRAMSHKSKESSTLLAIDSDSETDENVLQKITQAFGHLFSDHSSEDNEDESEETEMADNELSAADERPVFLEKGDARDDTQDSSADTALATYILAESRDCLSINVTSTAVQIFFKFWHVRSVSRFFLKSGGSAYAYASNKSCDLTMGSSPPSRLMFRYIWCRQTNGQVTGTAPLPLSFATMFQPAHALQWHFDLPLPLFRTTNIKLWFQESEAALELNSIWLEEFLFEVPDYHLLRDLKCHLTYFEWSSRPYDNLRDAMLQYYGIKHRLPKSDTTVPGSSSCKPPTPRPVQTTSLPTAPGYTGDTDHPAASSGLVTERPAPPGL